MRIVFAVMAFLLALPCGAIAAHSLFIDGPATAYVLLEHAVVFVVAVALFLSLVTLATWLILEQLER